MSTVSFHHFTILKYSSTPLSYAYTLQILIEFLKENVFNVGCHTMQNVVKLILCLFSSEYVYLLKHF